MNFRQPPKAQYFLSLGQCTVERFNKLKLISSRYFDNVTKQIKPYCERHAAVRHCISAYCQMKRLLANFCQAKKSTRESGKVIFAVIGSSSALEVTPVSKPPLESELPINCESFFC
jgi:hypothetical protein